MNSPMLQIVTREAIEAAREVFDRMRVPGAVISVWVVDADGCTECQGYSDRVCPADVARMHRDLAERFDRGEAGMTEVK